MALEKLREKIYGLRKDFDFASVREEYFHEIKRYLGNS